MKKSAKFRKKVEESSRPFRLYHAQEKRFLPWRCYKYHRNAVIGAWIEAKYAKVGQTIEVIDNRNSAMIGQYTRRATSVTFHQEKRNVKD